MTSLLKLAAEFEALADRAAVKFPERLDIQAAACALLGRWALDHRTEISRALGGAVGDRYAEGYAAAREDAAKKMDEKAADAEEGRRANDPYTENRRYYEIRTSAFSDAATAIRALKPQGGEE